VISQSVCKRQKSTPSSCARSSLQISLRMKPSPIRSLPSSQHNHNKNSTKRGERLIFPDLLDGIDRFHRATYSMLEYLGFLFLTCWNTYFLDVKEAGKEYERI